MRPEAIFPGGCGMSPMMARLVTDFPDPDSPTIASTSPRCTSRSISLRMASSPAPLGTRFSSVDELTALASALTDAGQGVLQMISDAYLSPDEVFTKAELALMTELVRQVRRPLSMISIRAKKPFVSMRSESAP